MLFCSRRRLEQILRGLCGSACLSEVARQRRPKKGAALETTIYYIVSPSKRQDYMHVKAGLLLLKADGVFLGVHRLHVFSDNGPHFRGRCSFNVISMAAGEELALRLQGVATMPLTLSRSHRSASGRLRTLRILITSPSSVATT